MVIDFYKTVEVIDNFVLHDHSTLNCYSGATCDVFNVKDTHIEPGSMTCHLKLLVLIHVSDDIPSFSLRGWVRSLSVRFPEEFHDLPGSKESLRVFFPRQSITNLKFQQNVIYVINQLFTK